MLNDNIHDSRLQARLKMVNQNFTQNWLPPRVNMHYPAFQNILQVNRVKLHFSRVIANLAFNIAINLVSLCVQVEKT